MKRIHWVFFSIMVLGLGACNREDEALNALKEWEKFNEELLVTIESKPSVEEGLDAGLDFVKSRKKLIIGKLQFLSNLRANEVSPQTQARVERLLYGKPETILNLYPTYYVESLRNPVVGDKSQEIVSLYHGIISEGIPE